jgi:hypothetical protein
MLGKTLDFLFPEPFDLLKFVLALFALFVWAAWSCGAI